MKKEGKENKKRTGLAGKIAVACTVVMLAAGGLYTYQREINAVPELTSYVDHEGDTVIIDGEEVPLGGAPKVTKKTKTSRKTVKLKKAAKKTRTKKKTKTKESTNTKNNGANQVVVKTTVITETKQKFKKNSKKKTIIKKVTTITETSVQPKGGSMGANNSGKVQSASSNKNGEARRVDLKSIAPKLNSTVMDAYYSLGFTVTIDPSVSYSGYFNARMQSITLRTQGDTIYHEIGHFVAFVAGNVDKKSDFAAIYNAEKAKYTGTNKNYVTQNSSEYFAEAYRDYTLNPSALKNSRPKTYQAIADAVAKITPQQINRLKAAYGPIWK